jgi:hypothetical protein
VQGSCKHGNEPSGPVKFWEVLERLCNWRLLKKVSPPWKVFFFLVSLGGERLSPLGTSATVGLFYQPRMIDDDYAVGGMRIGRGN